MPRTKTTIPPAGILQPSPVPSQPWSHIALDFITGLPHSEGNTTTLTIVDRFSKVEHFVPLNKLPTALEAAQLLVQHFFFPPLNFPQHPVELRTTVHLTGMESFLYNFGSQCDSHLRSSPQSNGQAERCNWELDVVLRWVINNNHNSWCKQLPWVENFHNNHTSSATGISPFKISLVYNPHLFPEEESKTLVPSVQQHISRWRKVWKQARRALMRSVLQNKKFADYYCSSAPTYAVGQKMWLSTRDIDLKDFPKKLCPRFIEPFRVEKIINQSAIRLHLPASLRVHHTFHVSLIKLVRTSPLTPPAVTLPPTWFLNDDPIHTVRTLGWLRTRGTIMGP